MEGDADDAGGMAEKNHFYPRPHMEGDAQSFAWSGCECNFYPRPHMEGDMTQVKLGGFVRISTHALTWRAT